MQSISKNTEQVILGGLLGDACVTKNNKYNSCMMVVHGPKQLEYLKFKYNFFFEDKLTTKKGIYSKIQHNKKMNKEYLAYGFFTKSIPLFSNYRTEFYPNEVKTVTRTILNKLDEFGLAIWFMDDGNRNIHWDTLDDGFKKVRTRNLVFNTQGFSISEHEIIKKYFDEVWDIDIHIYKQRSKYVTYLNATNSEKLIEILSPHMIPSLQYKLDLMYNVTHPISEEDRKIRMALGQPDQGDDIF